MCELVDRGEPNGGKAMKSCAEHLLDEIEADPKPWVVSRNRENYDRFLNLLLDLSYPNVHPTQIRGWRRRAHETWAFQDSLISENCTGGAENGEIISAIGALPISQRILYVHSGAMRHTLKAAATLFAATHRTFDVMEQFPTLEYWMGQYKCRSRFVTSWQRPTSFSIDRKSVV